MASSKIASTCDKLLFAFAHNPLAQDNYVDIAQCLSIVNRRMYRQGMNYAIGSIEFYARDGGFIEINSVPRTWVADNATSRGFFAWSAQRREVLKEQPSMKSRWSDFKVFLDPQHVTNGVLGNLTPIDSDGNPYALGEWIPSEIVFPVDGGAGGTTAANQQTMHVVGNNIPAGNFQVNSGTSFSLIEAYANSRRTLQDPDPSTTGVSETTNPYATLSVPDAMYQDVAENLIDNNNSPPYDNDLYPGGELNAPVAEFVDSAIVSNYGDSTVFSKAVVGGFVAPLGLLKISSRDFEADESISMIINLVPGNYKGILAEGGL